MQDMSCLISEPANSPPRILRSDTALERITAETKESRIKTMPKITRNHQKETQLSRRQNATVVDSSPVTIDPPHDNISVEEKNLSAHEEVFKCKVCDKEYNSSASLEKHLSTHTNNERSSPRCKMCDMTFSTNSGLHRHMRSHKQTSSHGSDTDSDASSSGSPKVNHDLPRGPRKRRVEYNNNNGSTDTSIEEDQSPTTRKKSKTINNNCINDFKLSCPVCDKKDFTSPIVFEMHMDEKHPTYQIERNLTISKKNNSVSGFDDCTFTDFSSRKFPEIAKAVCEQNIHKSITEQKFRCKACSRDFPCESALEIHEKCCDMNHTEESTSKSWHEQSSSASNEEARRDDFFAKLDLQNRSPNSSEQKRPTIEHSKPKILSYNTHRYTPISKDLRRHFVDNSKDLADIQSILSVAASGSLLEQLTQSSRNDHGSKDHDLEEVQDAFAAEFRKMKLRGEFPCRLCTAVFPNLRALKGHNRVHLSGNGAGPYRCNMCPHSSLDKAALVRHMRTHNGDRPYECAVCNYAFTTKANCERHLRNRHSKITREDVKRSIIYHPSEDPNNDEMNTKLNISREDIKRSQIFNNSMEASEHMDDVDRIKSERTTPVLYPRDLPASLQEHGLNIPIPRDLSIVIPQPRDIIRAHCSTETPIITTSDEIPASRIKVKGFGQLTQIPEFTPESDHDRDNYSDEEAVGPAEEPFCEKSSNYTNEAPMDLSTTDCQENVLDLSKKKSDKIEEKQAYEPDQDEYNSKALEFNNNHGIKAALYEKQMMIIRQQLIKNASMDPAAGFYTNPLSQFYGRTGAPFAGLGLSPAFPLNPYFLQHNPFLAPTVNPNLVDFNELMQKEIIRGLQLSGGGLVGMEHNNILGNMALAKERLQSMQQQAMSNDLNVKPEDEIKPQPLHVNTDTPTTIPFAPMVSSPIIPSPKLPKKETVPNQSPSSVKMVIKNGVLMPKQKQRRYRTERPFSCEHCSARFTLRSNMERHIKQQHPQFWSQRQRSAIGSLPRKSPLSLVPQNITVPSLGFDSRMNYMKSVHTEPPIMQDNDKVQIQNNQAVSPVSKNYAMISDQVKFAILAQQLKSQASAQQNDAKNKDIVVNGDNEDEDEEDALIIDEGTMDDKNHNSKQAKIVSESFEPDPNLAAKKVALEILTDASTKQDFDNKIAGNLINKNPQHFSSTAVNDIPTFVSQIGHSEQPKNSIPKAEEGDLVPVSRLLDNAASQMSFGKYFKGDYSGNSDSSRKDLNQQCEGSEEDEEGLVASSGSTSEGNNSGSDENRSDSEKATAAPQKKKSAYSLAPNRVSCPYCHRKFPWSSSLRRHVLTHTGQKPYKCPHCPLLFTTKSNCDRHLLRKHGSNSQQTLQVSSGATPPDATPIPELNNQGFMMRNVPERPFKCSICASSTFATLNNLRKHEMCKHGESSLPDSPKNADESHSRRESCDNEHQMSSDGERSPKHDDVDGDKNDWDNQISTTKSSPVHAQDIPSNMQNSDLPFKCHLCEGSYAERQVALDHIKEYHESEYELLVSKGALESGLTFTEELGSSASGHRSEGGEDQGGDDNIEQMRGKFPDYANRKVVCAFCMRRFWSAEDLRRHMRTHTGERPFSCDVCRRRFTLKHSMLRHRKKHSTSDNRSCEDMVSGDEDALSPSTSNHNHSSTMNSTNSNRTVSPIPNSHLSHANTSTPISGAPRFAQLNAYQIAINAKNLTSSPEIPSNVNNNNSPPAQTYDGKVKVHNTRRELNPRNRYSSEDTDAHESEVESGDLIGNLLGISDRGMINKLFSCPNEAAKLLGVKK